MTSSDDHTPKSTAPAAVVYLIDFVDQMHIGIDEWSSYVNRKTGEVVGLQTGAFGGGYAEPAEIELAKQIESSDDYIELPNSREADPWSIMCDFASAQADPLHVDKLLDELNRKRPYRRFKDCVYDLGISDEWYAFQQARLERSAIQWLEDQQLSWTREPPKNTNGSESQLN